MTTLAVWQPTAIRAVQPGRGDVINLPRRRPGAQLFPDSPWRLPLGAELFWVLTHPKPPRWWSITRYVYQGRHRAEVSDVR